MESLTLPGEIKSLQNIAEFVMEVAEEAGLEKKRIYRLRLAVDEIATNIVTHGYQESSLEGDITIYADNDGQSLTITLEDAGIPYDPLNRPPPDDLDAPLDERQMGGLGVFLAKKNVDEFAYEFVNGHNRNVFVVTF